MEEVKPIFKLGDKVIALRRPGVIDVGVVNVVLIEHSENEVNVYYRVGLDRDVVQEGSVFTFDSYKEYLKGVFDKRFEEELEAIKDRLEKAGH